MERGTDELVVDLIEAGVMAGCYWRKERLAAHPSARKGWVKLALYRRAVGAALMDEICSAAGVTQAAAAMPKTRG